MIGWLADGLVGGRAEEVVIGRASLAIRAGNCGTDGDYDDALAVAAGENVDLAGCFTSRRAMVESGSTIARRSTDAFSRCPIGWGRILTVADKLLANELIVLVDVRGEDQRVRAAREPPETVNTAGDVR
ncbi:hypothetical protein ACFYO1_10965 [Nocardia sp. NPDC006044]|uniref:hypothetical protein n=1 Tax=Nocardia sp. NPDC006044 TaxID=3364306 RepID=UPI00368C6E5D